MIRSYRWAACATLLFAAPSMAAPGPVALLEGGRSRHQIVLQSGASPSERFAAQELQTHFKACTNVELPIVEGAPSTDTPMILLGCGKLAAKLGVAPKPDQLGEQGFQIKTVPPHIVIAGTPEAGTLYGVHRFLEDVLGVRWFAPGVTRTPRAADLTAPSLDRLVKPAFLMRFTDYGWPGRDDVFLARQGHNANGHTPEHPQGTGYAFDGICHSYFTYISPGEFFKTHPEYFSEIGGVRIGEETQLCLTNPDVLRIVTERMLERMRTQPNVRQHNFSQMDYYNFCQCPKCTAINKQYGTRGGTQYWFLNRLAEQTSKVYPNKLIGTLAYTYTEEPPKGMTMHPNVCVWLCHMFPCCDSHPIATCPRNADYKRRALAWSKICSHLYVWHYIVDFAHYYNPFPNFRAMAADMRFYRDIGVEGMFLEGMPAAGGEFSLLRPYYGMKLIWNPDQNADAILRDFLDTYYGQAAKPIWDYIVMLHDKVADDNVHMHLYTNPAMGYLPDDVVRRAMELFDKAEAAVKDDPERLERVRVARMPVTYARLFPRNGYAIEDGRLSWLGDMAPQSEATRFVQRMKKHGFSILREQSGDPEQMIMLASVFNSRLEVVSLQNEHLAVDIVPILAGRILRITDRKTGRCVTAHNAKRCLFFPFAGGLENRVGESFQSFGWIEPATVTDRTDYAVTVSLQTMDGFHMKRTTTLAPDRPVLDVVTTVTNPKPKPAQVRLRGHLELNLGDLRATRVKFTNRAGKPIDTDIVPIIESLREGEHYYDRDTPAGSWTFTGSQGLQVTQTFDPDAIDFTWLYAYPEDLGQLDAEIWLKRTTLPPGQSATLRQSIKVQ
ncbi:MAG: DUF4838 domain-containing protein [Phycisphaerae bacterium]|nr:DUF4838 domain-containing protein [Phycisphaerae bacterium]